MQRPRPIVTNEQTGVLSGDTCLWCGAQVGAEHHENCVTWTRTVVIEFTTRYVVEVPEAWDQEDIDRYYNHGRWCANNALDDIQQHLEQGCLCGRVQIVYVREATKHDEEQGILKCATGMFS